MSRETIFNLFQCNHMFHSYSILNPTLPILFTSPLKQQNFTPLNESLMSVCGDLTSLERTTYVI